MPPYTDSKCAFGAELISTSDSRLSMNYFMMRFIEWGLNWSLNTCSSKQETAMTRQGARGR